MGLTTDDQKTATYLESKQDELKQRLTAFSEGCCKARRKDSGARHSTGCKGTGNVLTVPLLAQLLELSAQEDHAGAAVAVRAVATSVADGVATVLNATAIVAALLLTYLYPLVMDPAPLQPSAEAEGYFSSTNLATFQVFHYVLVNLAFGLSAYLVVTALSTSMTLKFRSTQPDLLLDFLLFTNECRITGTIHTLGFAVVFSLAAIPFNFALRGNHNGALALMIFYTVGTILCVLKASWACCSLYKDAKNTATKALLACKESETEHAGETEHAAAAEKPKDSATVYVPAHNGEPERATTAL